ncbi:MAG: redoxin family protein [Thermaerobacterales bacterium]
MAIKIGEKMPSLKLPGLDGTEIDLASYQGRKVLLFVWASW